ncbi:MAG: hypothetical protein ABW136_06340 [Steroidobacteraceae bacterium]
MNRHEENTTRFQLLPSLVALVLSVAITAGGAWAFARATGLDGTAVAQYGPKGIITVEVLGE